MASDLERRIFALADIEDIDEMTRLLCEWPDKTPEWLLYVDVRIGAPSSSKEQKALLKQVKAEALAIKPELAEKEVGERLVAKSSKPSTSRETQGTFVFTDEDRNNFEIIEALQDFECWDAEEITEYIASLDYAILDEAVQHLVNQYVYALIANGQKDKALDRLVEQNSYQAWLHSFAPDYVLSNTGFNVDSLMQLAALDNQVELISKKDYYAYLFEQGDESHASFDDFLQETGGLNQFTDLASNGELEQFERTFRVQLPDELKIFYQHAGSMRGTASKPCGIFSISELEYHLDSSRKKYEHLTGMGLLHMLEFVWGNNKDDFKSSAGHLTQDQIDYLNQHYTGIGYIPLDDNVNIVVYFDNQQRFGAVCYDQDDAVVYDDYLEPLLEKSQARYGLCQLLAVIPFIATNPLFEDKQKQYIADLADSN